MTSLSELPTGLPDPVDDGACVPGPAQHKFISNGKLGDNLVISLQLLNV